MAEIFYIFGSFGTGIFIAGALLCLAVAAFGFKFDTPCVVVVSLILGFGIGYFVSMAAWGEGIGTIYLGSCIGLLSLLVSAKVRPVKRFFLGGVSIFLAVSAVVVIIVDSIVGTTVTYDFYALEGGSYEQTAISARQSDLKKDMAAIVGTDADNVTAKLSEDRKTVTFTIPAANYGDLDEYGDALVAKYEELNDIEIVDYSTGWIIAIIIGAVFGIAGGVLAQFKKFEKIMQIVGTSIFGGVYAAIFAYLGLGDLSPLLIAPCLAVGAVFLQRFINKKKVTDEKTEEDYRQELPTV